MSPATERSNVVGPEELSQSIAGAYRLKLKTGKQRPLMIWGPPGVGKSMVTLETAEQIAAAMELTFKPHTTEVGDNDFGYIDIRALLFEPTDLRGLPYLGEDGFAAWALPSFLPKSGRGIIIIDELPAAAPAMQAALYQLLLDCRLGDYVLPKGWFIVGAGNRESDRAVAHKMPTALASRMIHLEYMVDTDAWVKWALKNCRMEVVQWIRFRKGANLHDFDPKKATVERTFPCPRTWEMVSDILEMGLPPVVERSMIVGTIGEGDGAEFCGFLKVWRDMPNPDLVLMDPQKAKVPTAGDAVYALVGALVTRVNEANWDSYLAYMARITEATGQEELEIFGVTEAFRAHPELAETRAGADWQVNHADAFIA